MSSGLPTVQMVLIVVVPVISLAAWLILVYLAARPPRRHDVGAVPATPGIEQAVAADDTEKQAA